MIDAVATLLAIEEIKRLKARYFRLVDIKDWSGLRALFCGEATLHYMDAGIGPQGLEEAMQFVEATLFDATTIHHGHMPEIELRSENQAEAIWAMQDQVFWPEGSPNPYGLYRMQGAGHYHETYEKRDGRWLIASLKLVRLRRTIELQPSRVL
jgi:hypothetical protein